MTAAQSESPVAEAASERIMVMDGAMGTMIQSYQLGTADYCGKRFADFPSDLKGANDLLNITQASIIEETYKVLYEEKPPLLALKDLMMEIMKEILYMLTI